MKKYSESVLILNNLLGLARYVEGSVRGILLDEGSSLADADVPAAAEPVASVVVEVEVPAANAWASVTFEGAFSPLFALLFLLPDSVEGSGLLGLGFFSDNNNHKVFIL